MNLECAILHVLSASPKALPVTIISGTLPAFYAGDSTHADINAALKRMEEAGEVKGTANKDRGTLWKETDDGRLRIA